jgi:glutathione-regulated potassium-efflux system ancillary protein KefC
MTETWFLATLWLGLALIATLISIWLRVATALSEIVVGTVGPIGYRCCEKIERKMRRR